MYKFENVCLKDVVDVMQSMIAGDYSFSEVGNNQPLTNNYKKEKDKIIVWCEVPGASDDDIEIEYKDNILVVKCDFKEGNIKQGKYSVRYRVTDIDSDNISAALDKGVLTITLPINPETQAKKINIKGE